MRYLSIIISLFIFIGVAVFFALRDTHTSTEILEQPGKNSGSFLSVLADRPDWADLEKFQKTINRADFERALTEIYTTDDTWQKYIKISDAQAAIRTSSDLSIEPFILKFVTSEPKKEVALNWQLTRDLAPAPDDKPLTDLHIAIDPGHIGGKWAKMESRWFQIGEGTPVTEGDMTLKVATLMKPMLETLGAKVTLVREKPEPVTELRPADMKGINQFPSGSNEEEQQKFREKLFYRTAEIRTRADLINETIKPDLVLCLHFNAAAWGDPEDPTLVPDNHFHILLNGGYTSDEVRLEDQRFALIEKLLRRTHEEEILIGKAVAETFVTISDLPGYSYTKDLGNVRHIEDSTYLFARNLLANRLYNPPVIFMEPYVMNSKLDYARAQAGYFKGLREVAGKLRPSIYQEYATALSAGLAKHYQKNR